MDSNTAIASNMIVNPDAETLKRATTDNDGDSNSARAPVDNSYNRQQGDNMEPARSSDIIDYNRAPSNDESQGETTETPNNGCAPSQANDNNEQENDPKNESSTLSTAFTISFDDDTTTVATKKQFGIRDSIRKFAPPKPHTIEKPRPSKSDNPENSYLSIESAPGGCPPKQSFRRDTNNSCRSSGRKSDSSRQSNISESAAFLIDKMLNCKQGDSLSSICLGSSERPQKDRKTRTKGTVGKKLAHSSDDILDDEIDFCDDKSDNGTYIVGADPESDAARRKIDELFGVVKAAEASLLASSNMRQSSGGTSHHRGGQATIARPSRLPDKKPLAQERQEHINRLATAGRHSSRSSSSSRQELASLVSQRQRSVTRHSRNSSCDRTSKLPSSRQRRAASQTSRHSSNLEPSDVGDTQSSQSSLHNDVDIMHQELNQQTSNNPSMKFNRAFALRRARLGLGEPAPLPRMASNQVSGTVPNGQTDFESLNRSPRRTLAQRYANHTSSSGQQQQHQNLSRNDGGRFSLRMRNNPVPSRLMSGVISQQQQQQQPQPSSQSQHQNQLDGSLSSHGVRSTSQQQGALVNAYLNKVSSSKGSRFNQSSSLTPSAGSIASANHHKNSVHSTSAMIPYQSSDELELSSSSNYRNLNARSLASRRENLSELEVDIDYTSEKFNYSLGLDLDSYKLSKSNRTCNSAGRRGSSSQLGALDCLVISAISSLSAKIRGSVCDLMVKHAKRLPTENETRLIVEEILPQLSTNSSRPKSPTSIEEIDQSLYFDLAQALKNLKKVEQMVDVMKQISNQIPASSSSSSSLHNSNPQKSPGHSRQPKRLAAAEIATTATEGSESNPNSESASLSPS